MFVGIWSRAEVLAFVGVLALLSLAVWRQKAFRLAATYGMAAVVVTGGLLLMYRLEGVDLSQALFYSAHTFLDSTPDAWLTPECQAEPTENCRERDGLMYFGPADLRAGILPMLIDHPITAVAKSARSALDNAWTLFGTNLSTFPGVVPFVVLVLAFNTPVRDALRRVPTAAWILAAAVVAESVLPPLTWAPPHPQYHVQLVLPIVVLLVPVLVELAHSPRGRLVAFAFVLGNAGLSAFRYTRYAGY
jgi:hypothetical protein